MGEAALVKEKRVTGRESMTFEWVFENRIAPELRQVQPLCLNFHWAECYCDKSTRPTSVSIRYKCDALIRKPARMADESTPVAGVAWREIAVA